MTWLAGRLTVWDETVVVLGVYYWIMNSQTETWLVGRLTLWIEVRYGGKAETWWVRKLILSKKPKVENL